MGRDYVRISDGSGADRLPDPGGMCCCGKTPVPNNSVCVCVGGGIQKVRWSNREELSSAMVSSLDYSAGDPVSIPAVVEFPTNIQFWATA